MFNFSCIKIVSLFCVSRQVFVIQSWTGTLVLRAGTGQSGSGQRAETVRTQRTAAAAAPQSASGAVLQWEISEERAHQKVRLQTHIKKNILLKKRFIRKLLFRIGTKYRTIYIYIYYFIYLFIYIVYIVNIFY